MNDLFEQRSLTIGDQQYSMLWVKRDNLCFDYIRRDWVDYWPLIRKWVRDTHCVVQAGGNCGMYPMLYSKIFDRVFTFEPDPMNFFCLSTNCTNSRVIKFNTAVGEACEYLTIGTENPWNVGMPRIGAGSTIIYSIALDSLDLHNVSLIHLDIEGFEYQALKGAMKTIERCRPTVVLEMQTMVEEIVDVMKQLKYDIVEQYGNPLNMVFVPKERNK